MELVWPDKQYLASYTAALERGWFPDNLRGAESAEEELLRIAASPERFLAAQVDRDAAAGPFALPDGTLVPRLPGYKRWMWDGEFCGLIGLRWKPGTEALPPHCLGHIGYTVVPWKRRQGYATRALHDLLPEAAGEGLRYVEICAEADNLPSRRVIESNGGLLVEEFVTLPALGARREVRYRIALTEVISGASAHLRKPPA